MGNMRRPAGERGASVVEYAGLIVLAGLVLGVLAPLIPGRVGETVPPALCRILHIGGGERCAGATPGSGDDGSKIDINPAWCVSSVEADGENMQYSYSIIGIGQGYSMVVYDSREEDLDGKMKHYKYVAFVDKGDVAIDLGKAKEGKKVDLGGGVYSNYGDMYRLTPEQYKKLDAQLWEYESSQQAAQQTGIIATLGQWLGRGGDWPPKLPQPAITWFEVTAQGSAEGKPPIPVNRLKTPAKYVLPNGASVATTQASTSTLEHWYIYQDDQGNIQPSTAQYDTISGTYTIGAKRTASNTSENGRGTNSGVNAGVTWDYSNTTRVIRDDETGKLRNIRYVITYGDEGSVGTDFGVTGKGNGKGKGQGSLGYSDTHSQGKLHTEVVQVNFSSDEERAAGESWLRNHGQEMPPEVAEQVFPKTGRMPGIPDEKPDVAPPPAGADPFDKLIYDKGIGWKTDADTAEHAMELNAMLPLGRGVGIDATGSSKDSKTMRAQILDAPGGDGKRHWIDYPDCTAAGNH